MILLNYNKLPEVFGCKGWLTIKIKSQTQLTQALEQARIHPKGVYIEVITDKYDYGQALNFFNSYFKGVPCINIESNTAYINKKYEVFYAQEVLISLV